MTVKGSVLITGASKGIGRAIAVKLAYNNQYKLALLSRDTNKLIETKKICEMVNPNVDIMLISCDITDNNKLKQNIDKINDTFGPLMILVNNAGYLYKHLINDEINYKNVQKSYDINVNAIINTCTYAMKYLIENKKKYPELTSAVVNIGSTASTLRGGSARLSIYASTKFAIRGFTTFLFKELRDYGIKVSIVMPGFVNTEMITNETHPGSSTKQVRQSMLKPNDVANAVEFVINSDQTCCPLEMLLYPQYNVMDVIKAQEKKKSKL